MKFSKKLVSLALSIVICLAFTLTGCHGSRGLEPFEIPEEFDTNREYEITFGQKMIQI